MGQELNNPSTESELMEFFKNPLIQSQLELIKSNTKKQIATEFLKEMICLYVKLINCEKINIQWNKNEQFKEWNILFENYKL